MYKNYADLEVLVNKFTIPDHRNRWTCSSTRRSRCCLVKLAGRRLWLAVAQAQHLSCTLCKTPENVEQNRVKLWTEQSKLWPNGTIRPLGDSMDGCLNALKLKMRRSTYLIDHSYGWSWHLVTVCKLEDDVQWSSMVVELNHLCRCGTEHFQEA